MVDMTDLAGAARGGSLAAGRAEPRALRSRTLILAAVREAVVDTPVDQLTVTGICRRAGVHRVTFYGHWPDVRAAASDAFAEAMDGMAAVGEGDVATASTPVELAGRYERALLDQLEEIRLHRQVYRTLAESSVFSARLLGLLHSRAELAVRSLMRAGVPVPGADSGIAAAHLAGGVAAASVLWANADSDDVQSALADFVAQLPGWWPRALE
jgi:AcrR family transcriptional regulator